jgi:hypothetical protein
VTQIGLFVFAPHEVEAIYDYHDESSDIGQLCIYKSGWSRAQTARPRASYQIGSWICRAAHSAHVYRHVATEPRFYETLNNKGLRQSKLAGSDSELMESLCRQEKAGELPLGVPRRRHTNPRSLSRQNVPS